MIANPSYKASGCGCGGGGGSLSVTPCGCGGADCAACQGQGIARPLFFAGQLLTEDDLQLLTEYVGQKDRLHNRHLFGDGVVCGLEVTCHPCGDGRVIVHPGYALDCCGNDLTLACAQPLDINGMIRDLRRDQLGGYDCGDPCPEPGTDVAKPAAVGVAGQVEAGTVKPLPKPLQYCLYVRYCEQFSEPVMPYSTGDDCGDLRCKPTRVREGVKFELRCRPQTEAANPLIQRLCACVGDLNRFRRVLEAFSMLDNYTALAQAALERDPAYKAFTQEDVGGLQSANNNLQRKIIETRAAVAAKNTPDFAGLTSSVRETALLLNRWNATPLETRTKLPAALGEVPRAQTNISEAVGFAVTSDSVATFNIVRDWLIERVNNAPYLTDCTLRNKVLAMGQPAPSKGSHDQAKMVVGGNQPLIEVFVNYLRDCVSRAVNPACTTCDDTAVLLACVEVKDCQVVKICNLERKFVLSPSAVRYWLPPLQLVGNLVERLLCDPLESLLRRPGGSGLDLDNLNMGEVLGDEVKRILADSLCLLNQDKVGVLSQGVDNLLDKSAARRREDAAQAARAKSQNPSGAVNVPGSAKNEASVEETAESKVDGAAEVAKPTSVALQKAEARAKKEDETGRAKAEVAAARAEIEKLEAELAQAREAAAARSEAESGKTEAISAPAKESPEEVKEVKVAARNTARTRKKAIAVAEAKPDAAAKVEPPADKPAKRVASRIKTKRAKGAKK